MCSAKTAKHTECKLPAKEGTSFCSRHQSLVQAQPKVTADEAKDGTTGYVDIRKFVTAVARETTPPAVAGSKADDAKDGTTPPAVAGSTADGAKDGTTPPAVEGLTTGGTTLDDSAAVDVVATTLDDPAAVDAAASLTTGDATRDDSAAAGDGSAVTFV
jgi:hypothetical protein